VDVIVRRWEVFTGKLAVLESERKMATSISQGTSGPV
jgi:hypothetical protein